MAQPLHQNPDRTAALLIPKPGGCARRVRGLVAILFVDEHRCERLQMTTTPCKCLKNRRTQRPSAGPPHRLRAQFSRRAILSYGLRSVQDAGSEQKKGAGKRGRTLMIKLRVMTKSGHSTAIRRRR